MKVDGSGGLKEDVVADNKVKEDDGVGCGGGSRSGGLKVGAWSGSKLWYVAFCFCLLRSGSPILTDGTL